MKIQQTDHEEMIWFGSDIKLDWFFLSNHWWEYFQSSILLNFSSIYLENAFPCLFILISTLSYKTVTLNFLNLNSLIRTTDYDITHLRAELINIYFLPTNFCYKYFEYFFCFLNYLLSAGILNDAGDSFVNGTSADELDVQIADSSWE